ncbi:UDP-N-acetylmuramoyl-tripeptide--D-alanyl-D-alanine ligase [Hazenella coriacea]|uniref:UDP-N-acetylmuramoyl-tripeptide--D-alanyl-D-alanine ligase n=1 Tax=Hazenella coriacea TaxID=1179467 RepID=A0A4R3L2G4_9BACL|nr:UDP-N-acetylmuramoyl-tripeptide--D-alanyl-D-alanine ligase [Hazenella coriacea]TCS93831.1 UDP-N-acetylmuramoyl-tripeptide--D-alanyl-D-alanine ligase [Hazenella coriacea]
MFPITLGQLARVVGGRLIRGNPSSPVRFAIYQQVRHLGTGKVLFLYTSFSKKFNLSELRSKKSAGIITTAQWASSIPHHHPLIIVSNVNEALWSLARWQRQKSKALVIGVTGSQGKTTTKEMLASILMKKFITFRSPSNLNVAAYTPSHLFHLTGRHQVAVLEMGMRSLGNIRRQCILAKPKIGIVTNVGEAHVGNLGNTLDNVARAKQELINGLDPKGILILNADDPGSKKLSLKNFRGKVIRIGIKNRADLQATAIRFQLNGMHFKVNGVPYYIKTWGQHNVYNALASIAVARQIGVPTQSIQQGLLHYSSPYMRLQRVQGKNKRLLINDAYNANPSSMIAGLKVLNYISQKRPSVAVLGDIGELGKYSANGHARVGRYVAQTKPTYLITIGSQAAIIARTAQAHGYPANRIRTFTKQAQALHYIHSTIPSGSIVYFKASRKVGLEWLVKQLRK